MLSRGDLGWELEGRSPLSYTEEEVTEGVLATEGVKWLLAAVGGPEEGPQGSEIHHIHLRGGGKFR